MSKFSAELKQLYESDRWKYVIRPAVLKRDDYTCQCCGIKILPGKGSKSRHLQCDHMVYIERGRPLADYYKQPISQMQTLCNICHKKKSVQERKARRSVKSR